MLFLGMRAYCCKCEFIFNVSNNCKDHDSCCRHECKNNRMAHVDTRGNSDQCDNIMKYVKKPQGFWSFFFPFFCLFVFFLFLFFLRKKNFFECLTTKHE